MKQRIIAIDILRGFALLGILLMNIMSFSMPDVAYFNPLAYGGDEWLNRLAYYFVHVFADQKFMALFSMLFGGSVMLLLNKLAEKRQKSARFHYTRNFWLLIIGLLHSLFIWSGDVLTVYALCSFVLYFLRKLKPRWQLLLGLLIFFTPTVFNVVAAGELSGFNSAEITTLNNYWLPNNATLQAELAHYRGDYWPQVSSRFYNESPSDNSADTAALDLYYVILISDFFARALGMMLIGMALYTLGILTAQRSDNFYRRMLLAGLLGGIPLAIVGLLLNHANGWQASYTVFLGTVPNQFATPLIASGYIGLIMLWSRRPLWSKLQDRLAAIGRTALSNYIGQSLLATTIFYGFGLGLYGSVNRAAQLLIVLAIWLFQLWVSPLWLKHFRFGPLEWIWRSLSYWQRQPLRKNQSPTNRVMQDGVR